MSPKERTGRRLPGQRLVEGRTVSAWLWAVLAAGVGLSGGRRSRRGALRGLLAVALTEVLGRRLARVGSTGGARRTDRAPRRIGAATAPGTKAKRRSSRAGPARDRLSRPVASAFALATGVAQEHPSRGAALVPVIGGLILRRVRAGRDTTGAAVAGMLTGTAVALATRRLWNVSPAQPAAAPRVWSVVAGRPEPEGDGLLVVVNPSSGPAWTANPADELRSRLPRAQVLELSPGDDLAGLLQRAHSEEVRALGVAGGDGTVCAAVEVALQADVPLLVVPAGTLNHFARDLGVDTVADAVHAVQAGELVAVDVATIDGRPFVNTASFGSYAELVDAREQLEGRVGKWPAVLVALSKVLWRVRPAEVEIDGERTKVWMIFIGNCCYQPEGLAPSWRERLDDGVVDVRLVDGSSPFSRTRLLLAAVTGRLTRTPVYRRRVVESLRIRSTEGPLRLARDGETFDGGADVVVAKQPGRLRVFRPATSG